MDDNNNNIFEVLDSPSSTKTIKITSTSTNVISLRRSHLPLMNAGNGKYSSLSSSSSATTLSSPGELLRNRRRERAIQDLGFANPGPKNLVNMATVPTRRLKTRQPAAQEKPSSSKPLYDKSGHLVSDQTDRCDCNSLTCPGCFLPCTSCQSSKCGLECRNLRTYTYEYRLYESSLRSLEWLLKTDIVNPLSTSTIPSKQSSIPVILSSTNIPPKIEADEIELPTSTDHSRPPCSYVTLIRQAILSTHMQRMTLNEIYQWIIDSYPYFRTAPSKWKNSIRHNLSLNKCFKRLQRSTNDPGKGSYWAVEESNETNHQSNSRKRRLEDIQRSLDVSPLGNNQQSAAFYNNPMIWDGVVSIGGQSSADESDSTMSFVGNPSLIPWNDLNDDFTASFRRFRDQILDAPSTTWIAPSDAPSTSAAAANSWGHDFFPHGETNSFFESVKMASSGEINWHDVDVKPYCEFLDGFRTNTVFQQQDRDKLLNLASSLSSFFDYTGITNLAQTKIANDSLATNRSPIVPNRTLSEAAINRTPPPVVIEEEAFDWDSIT